MSATVFWLDGNEFATLQNIFKVNNVPTDPTTVTLTVTDPAGATSTPTPTHVGAGTFSANVACNPSVAGLFGVWSYLWEGTGTASDAVAGTWTVLDPALTKLYATPEELKSRLGITDTQDDLEVQLAVQAASRDVDDITGRYFWRGSDTRTYVPQSMYGQQVDDLVSVSTFKVDFDGDGIYEQTWVQNTDYALTVAPGAYNPAARGESWPFTGFQVIGTGKFIPFVWPWSHQDRIQIAGVFGWPAVPWAVKQAALIGAADIFKMKDAPFGIAGFGEFGAIRVGQNPKVLRLLHRYISGDRVGV